jgi:dsDNA-binding SOS-regulon protein
MAIAYALERYSSIRQRGGNAVRFPESEAADDWDKMVTKARKA